MKTLKNKAKKGFTIVELVIVIAVIAILAAVLIPTFTNVTESAKESAAMQECRAEWSNFLVEVATETENRDYYVAYDADYKEGDTFKADYYFNIDGLSFNTELITDVSEIEAAEVDGYDAEDAVEATDSLYSDYDYENIRVQIYVFTYTAQ